MKKLSIIIMFMMIIYSMLSLCNANAKDANTDTTQNSSVTPIATKNPTAEDQPNDKKQIVYYPNDPDPYVICDECFDPDPTNYNGPIGIELIEKSDGTMMVLVTPYSPTYKKIKENELKEIDAGFLVLGVAAAPTIPLSTPIGSTPVAPLAQSSSFSPDTIRQWQESVRAEIENARTRLVTATTAQGQEEAQRQVVALQAHLTRLMELAPLQQSSRYSGPTTSGVAATIISSGVGFNEVRWFFPGADWWTSPTDPHER